MADRFRIRPATAADLPGLAQLEEASFSDPWTSEMIAGAVATPGAVALLAETDDHRVVGSVLGRVVGDEAEILTIAVEPALRGSFHVVPPEAWSDDQLEMADYLTAWDAGEAEGKLPFLWVVQADGTLARAVTTRELAFAALDRAHAWRTLQELGGVNNEWARRAAEAAREEALSEAEAERQKLSESHEAEVAEVRSSAAAEAMQRLVDVLMDLDSAPVPRATATVTASAPAPAPAPAPDVEDAPAEADAAEPAPAEEADDDVSFDDPFIDTVLCTTCNECTNLNPRLFKYDANKQAYIADASAGTYLDLVVAAEKCPANIIHPGAPRADDSTATPDVIERAKPYS